MTPTTQQVLIGLVVLAVIGGIIAIVLWQTGQFDTETPAPVDKAPNITIEPVVIVQDPPPADDPDDATDPAPADEPDVVRPLFDGVYSIFHKQDIFVFTKSKKDGTRLEIDAKGKAKCDGGDNCMFTIVPVDESRNVYRFKNEDDNYVGVEKDKKGERVQLLKEKDCKKERCDWIIDSERTAIFLAADPELAMREKSDDKVEIDQFEEGKDRYQFNLAEMTEV